MYLFSLYDQIIKRDRKSYIINISKEYSIVSQFTSFVAIEKREKVSSDGGAPDLCNSYMHADDTRMRSLTNQKVHQS